MPPRSARSSIRKRIALKEPGGGCDPGKGARRGATAPIGTVPMRHRIAGLTGYLGLLPSRSTVPRHAYAGHKGIPVSRCAALTKRPYVSSPIPRSACGGHARCRSRAAGRRGGAAETLIILRTPCGTIHARMPGRKTMAASDRKYFKRRTLQELRCAMDSTCIEAEISHAKLAGLHRQRCAGCSRHKTDECICCALACICNDRHDDNALHTGIVPAIETVQQARIAARSASRVSGSSARTRSRRGLGDRYAPPP